MARHSFALIARAAEANQAQRATQDHDRNQQDVGEPNLEGPNLDEPKLDEPNLDGPNLGGRDAVLQDWIGYHRAIGFSHIYLYATDADPTRLAHVLTPYLHGPDPPVTFRHCPGADARTIHLHAIANLQRETDWLCALDVEEFLVLRQQDDLYAFMLDHRHRGDAVCFNTVPCGCAHLPRRTMAPMLMTHLWRAAEPTASTRLLWRAQALTPDRARTTTGSFWQAPDALGPSGPRCHDVLYQDMAGYSAEPARFMHRPGFTRAVLDRAYVADLRAPAPLAPQPAVYDPYLAGFWHRHTAPTRHMALRPDHPPPRPDNIALGKPSWQSSIFHPGGAEPPGSRTFGGGNNGLHPGSYGFHTTREPAPWWIVDLLALHEISEILVHNRADDTDVAARAASLEVRISADGAHWHTLFSRPDQPFGLDRQPLRIVPKPSSTARFVMVRLRNEGILHLEEVEVYGVAATREVDLIGSALTREALSPA